MRHGHENTTAYFVDACTGENANSACCPLASAVSVPLAPRVAAAIAADQPRPVDRARAIGRIDHLAVLVDQYRVRVARQVVVQRGGDEVVLAERDDADQRAGEPPTARDGLDDLQGASQPRLVAGAEQRSRRSAARGEEPRPVAERVPAEVRAIGHRADTDPVGRQQQHRRVVEDGVLVRAGQDLLLGQEVGVVRQHLRQQRQPLELFLQDLEVVAQRERAVLGEQLVFGRQLTTHRAGRLVDRGPARQADGNDQQRRKNQGELGTEGQRLRALTLADCPRAVMSGRVGTFTV